jgi:hypothetical protein
MPPKPAGLATALLLLVAVGCDTTTGLPMISVSPCATGSWRGASGNFVVSLSLQASEDCSNHPPTSAEVQGTGTVTQGSTNTLVTVAGSQQWMDLAVVWRSADSSLVVSYAGRFGARDSVLGVLTCSRGCGLAVDSSFVLLRQ